MSSYTDLVKMSKRSRDEAASRRPATKRAVKGGAVVVHSPYIAIIACAQTFIRLPDDHPWLSADPSDVINRGGFPMECIGWALQVTQFPLKTGFKKEVSKWLMDQFTEDEILQLFKADILADLGKTSPKRWLCLDYFHLTHPGSAALLAHRIEDAYAAVAAAQKSYKSL